ncbi:PKD domain-containing protein [Polluticoccus soli]|uniref:PKD domain-containing protein n=1 Tax=Polluticoccus soli TaxID=3034150 RepID=UPI0023E2F484|nr:PKD domain-containing protein [Flavipsychrobacter sp. JY13-12]
MAILLPGLTIAQPVASFSANVVSGCSPIVVQFTDQSTGGPSSWTWNLGNGSNSTLQNPSTTYINPGTYTITLTVSNAGGTNTKTVTNYITVFASPVVNFTADSTPSCPPKSVLFNNLTIPGASGTTTYLWDFGNGQTSNAVNPIFTYNSVSNYTITLLATNSNGCSNSLTKPGYIQLTAKPQAAFTASSIIGCSAPFTTTFNNSSTSAISYNWDFGDGQTSTLTNPSHTYNTSGNYNVRLISTNAAGCKDTMLKTAYVSVGTMQALFNVSDSTVCANEVVNFLNTSTPSSATVTWLFGDGNSSSVGTPTHGYTAAGTYTAKLVITQNGCSDTAQKTIVVSAKPTSQFTVNNTQSCTLPFTTQFTNGSSGASSYLWIFGDGTTSTQQSPSKTYNAAGQFTVKLVSYNATGCTDTYTVNNLIKIQPLTAGLFNNVTLDPALGCAPATTTFFGGTSPSLLFGVTSYAWNFGNGNTTTTAVSSALQTFNTAGTYTVSLTYNTIPGCSFTKQTTFTIGAKPTASFSPGPDTVCPNTAVSFTNTSTGASSYKWYFGDGDSSTVTNPSHAYQLAGNFAVTLVAFNGTCSDTFIIPNRVHVEYPTAWFIPSFNCSNRLQFTFTDGSIGGYTYSWNFGDGQTSTQVGTVTHTFASYGTYHVLLTITNTATGCSDFYGMNVYAYPLTAQFSANDTAICKGNVTVFTATAVPHAANYAWYPGDGGLTYSGFHVNSYTYLTSGIYNVKLVVTDSNGCKDSLSKPNYMHVGGPNPNFTATPVSGCAPLNVTLTDQSTSGVGAINNRTWQFGDNTSQTTTSSFVSHTYPAGTYTVKLKVADVLGCQDSITKVNHITAYTAFASFSSLDTNVCIGQLVNFVNGSNSASGTWYFGDGQTSTSYAASHAYSAPGNYTVKLIVDANGCKDSMIRTTYIKVQPLNVNFSMSDSFEACPPLTVNFAAGAGLTNYSWSFGNNSQSTIANPTTIYTYPGVYTIKLKAQNSVGCADSATKTVTVLGPTGTLSYTPISGCKPLTVSFTSTNSNTQSLIWDMSNGVTQSTPASSGLTYTYTQAGKFVPKLILSDGASCLVPITGADTIRVDSLGADFTFAPGALCQTGTIQFIDTVYYSLSAASTHSWTFGDGGISTAHNPSHTYMAPGTYQVKLVLANNSGCSDTVIKTVTVHAQPTVNAGNNIAICQGQTTPVQLLATGATSYVWSPATNLSCTTCANPTTIPAATTTYTVIGTDNNGCKDTNTVTVTVDPLPSVTAGLNQAICLGDSAQIQATGATTYSWSPATGLSCTNCANPKASPAVTTQYVVTGINSNGCSDTGIVTVAVNGLPNVSAGANNIICAGDSTQLQASGAVSYTWSPVTGLSCVSCSNPKTSPATTTTYVVTGTNASGCVDTGIVTVTVNSLPNVTASNNQSICIGGSAQLQASGATSFSWSPATGLSCTTCANPTATPTTTTTYVVTGTNASGCIDTAHVTVTVNALPTVSAGADQSICIGSSAQLQATGATTYVWSPATGLSCTTCSNPVANPTATTTYTVTGTNANGCVNTSQVTITVKPQPTVGAGANTSVCVGKSTQLQATGAATFVWSPTSGLSCTTCPNPTAAPTATTTYAVIGTGANGCTDTAQVTVTVDPLPTVSAGPNQNICAGSSTQLQASGTATYVWSPATGLSCTTCANPVATPATTTIYTVTGANANGCTNTSTVTITVNAIPVVTATATNKTICAGTSTPLQASGATSYSWTPATGLSCISCPNPVATPGSTTTYVVTGMVNGCQDTAHVTINVLPKPNVSAGNNAGICVGNSVTLHGTGAQNYVWSPAKGLSCTSCPDPVANPSATTTYTLTGTDANGCTNNASVTVTIHPVPNIDAGEDKTVCAGSSVKLVANGGASYMWSPGQTLDCTNCSSPIAKPVANSTYKVVGIDAFGCSDSDEINVTVIEKQPVSVGPDASICEGGSAQLSATGGTSYLWFPSYGLSSDKQAMTTASPASTTTYNVIIKQGDCFADTAEVMVEVHGLPTVDAGPDQNAVAGNPVQLNAEGTGIASYLWSPGDKLNCVDCKSPIANALRTTTYRVAVKNQWGCEANDEVTINVTCDATQLFVPNTFTPNGDGINDKFFPQGKGLTSIKRFRVFNRWGEMMFEANNIPLNDENFGWDGSRNLTPLKPDVFVYIINATCESGEPIEIKGDVSLVR